MNIYRRSCLNLLHRIRSHTFSNKTDFGFQEIPILEKERMVKEVFSRVAQKYDIMNDFMSLGAHRLWKDELIKMLGIKSAAYLQPDILPKHLDVAGGTGDIAFRVIKEFELHYRQDLISHSIKSCNESDSCSSRDYEINKQVIVCDINPSMLEVGKKRSSSILPNSYPLLGFVEGNAESLPFPDNTFDIYTIAFGLRNVTNKEIALQEAYRVLKKSGRILILEFSQVQNPLLRTFYDQYSFSIIPQIGKYIANDEASYQYLVESIRKFPPQEELLKMVRDAGFLCTNYTNFTNGIVAVHSGFKL